MSDNSANISYDAFYDSDEDDNKKTPCSTWLWLFSGSLTVALIDLLIQGNWDGVIGVFATMVTFTFIGCYLRKHCEEQPTLHTHEEMQSATADINEP